ncbi:hypothetical protein G210_0009 [Candida maltosa Xu316]|uniref:Uncharacterized protein n=1 Tax=Candida maltosa (strain Xu316) TaxID=1245528 RepID=M3K1X2_CANMX|nr:hypothetical protein G210_0009 [Candida maltosa Xu316]
MEFKDIPIINDTIVPDSDAEIRQKLQELGHPMVLPNETEELRKQRYINITQPTDHQNIDNSGDEIEEDEEEEEEEFYTPGVEAVFDKRKDILSFSVLRASERLKRLKAMNPVPMSNKYDDERFIEILESRRSLNSQLSQFDMYGTQLIPGNTRAISCVRYSKMSEYIAVGSWDGSVSILNSNDLLVVKRAVPGKYHTEKVSALDWDMSNDHIDKNKLVSGGNEGTLNLWTIEGKDAFTPEISIKEAHDQRITKTLFHPISDLIISTSFDKTWKLWDMSKQTELYQQEGHSKEVFSGAIHPDGSLFTSGGLDGAVITWDLRSGRSILSFGNHLGGIYSVDWSSNGYHLVAGDANGVIRVYDIYKKVKIVVNF